MKSCLERFLEKADLENRSWVDTSKVLIPEIDITLPNVNKIYKVPNYLEIIKRESIFSQTS